ncbi:MAG: Ldh family oxidoreductase [Caldilineales bacterium]|nr:Ldh family oxidoreductase [Caldilineales bacterium]
MPTTSTRVAAQDLTAFCLEVMRISGLSEEDSVLSTEVLVTADTWGTFTHGTRQLRGLMKDVRLGAVDPEASPTVTGEGSSWALVDAHAAMPPASAYRAMQIAIEKARETGVAYVGVRNGGHFAAAGFYAYLAARADMIGVSTGNVDPGVTVTGSRGRVLGTNPLAYAVPAGVEYPLLFDIATSAVAATKLYAAVAEGRPIPDTWLVDEDGLPTTNGSIYPELGALMPMAGHKGYGLALFVEVLSAVLSGAAITKDVHSWVMHPDKPGNQGYGFLVIAVEQIMPLAIFKERMDGLIREIRSAPKAKGVDRIYLPGEIEQEKRDIAMIEGIVLPPDVVVSLRGLAEDVGLDADTLFKSEGEGQ